MLSLLFLLLAGGDAAPVALSDLLKSGSELPAQAEPAPEKTEPKWTGSVAAGAKLTTGNSETRGGNASANAELRRERDRFTLNFQWLFDENANNPANDWVLTDRKTYGSGKYDYFLTKKTYALAQASLQNDHAADLDLRQIYGVGLGRQFREDEKVKFGGELGLSWVDEDYGGPGDKEYLAARAAYKLLWNIDKSWSFGNAVEAYPSLDDKDDVLVRADTSLKSTFGEKMFAQLQWLFDWNNTPAPGKEREDHQFLLSLGWKF